MMVRAGLILMSGLVSAEAQEAKVPGQDMAGLMQSLPEKTLKKLRGAPEAFMEDAAGLIYGFGASGGIDLVGIDAFVAAERARIRAAVMERYLAADLDNDGDVTRDEVAVLANAAAAGKRGKLRLGHDLADGNKDGVLSLDELRSHAQEQAMKDMSVDDAEGLRGFLMFDLDGDGVVAMEEVAAGVTAMVDDV
jgi:EF hand